MEEKKKDEGQKVEPVNKVDATKDSKRESKSSNDKSGKIILEFLRGCTPFECDAIRVMVGTSEGNTNLASINKDDLLAVNRYLNYGLTKEDGNSFDKVLAHRQQRAQSLMKTVGSFVGKVENPARVDPVCQAKLTPFAKIRLPPCTKIKMTPVGM